MLVFRVGRRYINNSHDKPMRADQRHEFSSRAPRLADIALRAGVSRAAVGRVLLGTGEGRVRVAEHTAERIRALADEMGYRPNAAARALKGIHRPQVGVLMHSENLPVMTARLMAIEAAAAARGIRLRVGWFRGDAARLREDLAEFQERELDGLILLFDLTGRRDRLLRNAIRPNARVVFHGRPLRRGDKCARVDTRQGVHLLVRHLLERGHRRIGLELFNMDDRLMHLRKEAYHEALAEAGIPPVASHIWTGSGPGSEPGPQHLNDALDQFLDGEGIDALIASNDIWAVRFIQQLNARGLSVPGDVAVTGYDNLDISRVIVPALTTVDQNHAAYAEAALQLLLDGDDGEPERVIMPCLVPRASS